MNSAKSLTVSDEDAKKIFEQRRDPYATPERRRGLPDRFHEHGRGKGRPREDRSRHLVRGRHNIKERKLTPTDIDLGSVTKAAIGDPAGDCRRRLLARP